MTENNLNESTVVVNDVCDNAEMVEAQASSNIGEKVANATIFGLAGVGAITLGKKFVNKVVKPCFAKLKDARAAKKAEKLAKEKEAAKAEENKEVTEKEVTE